METKIKHTPGPWAINQRGGLVDKGLGLNLLTGRKNKIEEQANRALCAAAPELLAALERLVAYETGAENYTPMDALITEARAAISKAKGE